MMLGFVINTNVYFPKIQHRLGRIFSWKGNRSCSHLKKKSPNSYISSKDHTFTIRIVVHTAEVNSRKRLRSISWEKPNKRLNVHSSGSKKSKYYKSSYIACFILGLKHLNPVDQNIITELTNVTQPSHFTKSLWSIRTQKCRSVGHGEGGHQGFSRRLTIVPLYHFLGQIQRYFPVIIKARCSVPKDILLLTCSFAWPQISNQKSLDTPSSRCTSKYKRQLILWLWSYMSFTGHNEELV